MKLIGDDFRSAWRGWHYPTEPLQSFWRASGLGFLVFAVNTLLQGLFAFLIAAFAFGVQPSALATKAGTMVPELLKAAVIGIFPAMVITAALALYLAKFGLPARAGRLPLRWPKLGVLGWVLLLIGFIVIVGLASAVLFRLTGVDPSTYQASPDGLSDAKSNAGLVEKTMADLAKNPTLFLLAVPSVVIGAPIAEELIFRGALFSGIMRTRLGRPGAVIITAGLWSIAHAGPAPWMVVGILFMMGLLLGILLLRFGSIWVTIACHALWNAVQIVGLFAIGHGS